MMGSRQIIVGCEVESEYSYDMLGRVNELCIELVSRLGEEVRKAQ